MQGRLRCLWLAGLALLWALPLAAQVEYGKLHAGANGELTGGYGGDFGDQQTSDHSLGFGANGTINGYYYNPRFISFSVQPYYGRSQNNSESQSITDSSGYMGTVNFFGGSHFPGFVSFNQNWNSSGTFGIPGEAGLITKGDSHGFDVGWNVLLPGLPTLSIGYFDTSSSSSLLGSDSSTASTTRNLNVGSSYRLAGFSLNGGFVHTNTDTNLTGVLGNGETETATDSSNSYHLSAIRKLPFYHSQFSVGASRSSYSGASDGSEENGTTDNVNANLNLGFPKLPVAISANYTDNIFGSFQQQLINSGQAPLPGLENPKSRSLLVMASTFYTVLPHLTLNGYVDHTEQYFNGQDYGLTQFGINVNYNFLRRIKGLTFMAGMVDSADQQGNTRVGFVGNANYSRTFGRWEVGSYFMYDQDVETLLVTYTTSTMNYGASVKRDLYHDLRWVGVVSAGRSVFEQQAGNGSQSESFTSMLMGRKFALSANYTQSNGTSILTANGLVPAPLPVSLLSASNLIVYNGKSYGGSFRVNPNRNLLINTSYSKSEGNTVSPLMLSSNGTTMYYGLAEYRLRKMLFTAGCTKFRQSISSSSTLPSVVTSYYFGVTRWFKGF